MPTPSWSRERPELPVLAAVTQLRWVNATGSTHQDLAAGPPMAPGQIVVLATEEQTAGRGRSDRSWHCPPGAGLMFSVRLNLAGVPPTRRGWIGAVLGLAVIDALPVPATLKWPNDVLLAGAKVAGILAEGIGDDVVVGAGINVCMTRDELPRPDATSLLLAGAEPVERADLLTKILGDFLALVDRWRKAAGDVDAAGIRARYRQECSTLGTDVVLHLPGGGRVTGTAIDVDHCGAIIVDTAAGRRAYAAGDVVHLRRSGP